MAVNLWKNKQLHGNYKNNKSQEKFPEGKNIKKAEIYGIIVSNNTAIEKLINTKIKNEKAEGLCGTPIEFLKYEPEELYSLITYIFNHFLYAEEVPME